MKSIVTISGTSRPDNYTSSALSVVNDELERRGVMEFLRSYVCPKHVLEEIVREGAGRPWTTTV